MSSHTTQHQTGSPQWSFISSDWSLSVLDQSCTGLDWSVDRTRTDQTGPQWSSPVFVPVFRFWAKKLDWTRLSNSRRILFADVERYYMIAIDNVKCNWCGINDYMYDAHNLLQKVAISGPLWSMPDHWWGADFINDTCLRINSIKHLMIHVNNNLRSIVDCTEWVNGVNPEGIVVHSFSQKQENTIWSTLWWLDQTLGEEDPTECCFTCYKDQCVHTEEVKPHIIHLLPSKPTTTLPLSTKLPTKTNRPLPHLLWCQPPLPSQSAHLTAMNVSQKSNSNSHITSATRHKVVSSLPPMTSCVTFTPQMPQHGIRSRSSYEMRNDDGNPSSSSSIWLTTSTMTLPTSTRQLRLTTQCGHQTHGMCNHEMSNFARLSRLPSWHTGTPIPCYNAYDNFDYDNYSDDTYERSD